MSQKELLYYEDAINHEIATIKVCQSILKELKDSELCNFMENEINHHEMIKTNLLKQMEECCNE